MYLAAKLHPNRSRTELNFKKEDTVFFESSPHLSCHLSGRIHIKDPRKGRIPGLFINSVSRLDDPEPNRLFTIAIKNPVGFSKFSAARDAADEENMNLFLDNTDSSPPERIGCIGRRFVLSKDNPWHANTPPHLPIIGRRHDGIPTVCFHFEQPNENNRVLIMLEFHFNSPFETSEATSVSISAGIPEQDNAQLVIWAPCNPSKVQYH
ncbi:MAG TPA: hypothetical protein PKD72_04185 [Gemmatales bacterium]|nr:hypothetical protein [Gemmatales bacterium]